MFLTTSFFGVILGNYDHEFQYGNYSTVEINILPCLFYCFMIALCIYPFFRYNSNKPRNLKTIENEKFFDIIAYIYIVTFFSLLAIFWEDIIFRIAFGDMDALRKMQYNGELSNTLDRGNGIFRTIGGLLTVIGDGAYFMIPFFYYSICKLKKRTIYNFMLLLSSTTPVLLGFINIDRSKTAFWILLFILSYILFRPHILKKKPRPFLGTMITGVVGTLLFYLTVVTISRFGGRDEGTSGGLLCYLGQPFINFCCIWDNVESDHFFSTRIMPISSYFLSGETEAKAVLKFVESTLQKTGIHINVFFSFLGMFIVDAGHFGVLLISLFIFIVSSKVLSLYQYKNEQTLASIIVVFAFATILQCGIVTYFYTTVGRALSFWFFIWYSHRYFK
jgi:oligosaccharide repeat unit polymerase